ncbi:F-box domain [Arabidopsis suecica]|uniref:F-box domain n=1 Tax=Arabidopsis suecica TaxID=45249 RepID=A0A8T2BNA8_ARASU|nr:F-box domain [Arabidopsis suecica]
MRTQPSHLAPPHCDPSFLLGCCRSVRSDHHQNRMTGDKIDGVDNISSLPDEILYVIFSFIPTKFAIRTSVLSKRWRHVWSETPFLSIDCRTADANSINKTLDNYPAPKIMSFHLCFSSKAHDLARARNMEKLSLEFLITIFLLLVPKATLGRPRNY